MSDESLGCERSLFWETEVRLVVDPHHIIGEEVAAEGREDGEERGEAEEPRRQLPSQRPRRQPLPRVGRQQMARHKVGPKREQVPEERTVGDDARPWGGLPWPRHAATAPSPGVGGGAPGGPWPDGEDGSTCLIMSCVESEKDFADTLKKTEK